MLRKLFWGGVGACTLLLSANKWGYDYLVMPFLLRVDPEKAHRMAVWACSFGLVPRSFQKDPNELVCRMLALPACCIYTRMNTVCVFHCVQLCAYVSLFMSRPAH